MTRAAWLVVLAACSSKPTESKAPPPPPPPPKPAPAPPVVAEREPPDAAPVPDAAEGLAGTFYALGASADQAHLLIANVYAPAETGTLEYRVVSATTGAIETTRAMPALSKLPGLFERNPAAWPAAIQNNPDLVTELTGVGELVVKFPGGDGAVVTTSADRAVMAVRRDLHWILLRGGALSIFPEEHVEPWIAPDGKTLVHSSKPITRGLANASGLFVEDLATGTSTKLLDADHVTGIERWRLAPGGDYVRVPYGGDTLCVGDVPLHGAKKRPPQCFGKLPTPILTISDNGQWLAIESEVRGKMRLRVVDLDARKTVVDNATLDLGDAGVDDNVVVGATGVTFALHGKRGYQIDAATGKITEFTHDPALSCIVVGTRLGCVRGQRVVFEDPSSQKP
jgi:hypothetical protein